MTPKNRGRDTFLWGNDAVFQGGTRLALFELGTAI